MSSRRGASSPRGRRRASSLPQLYRVLPPETRLPLPAHTRASAHRAPRRWREEAATLPRRLYAGGHPGRQFPRVLHGSILRRGRGGRAADALQRFGWKLRHRAHKAQRWLSGPTALPHGGDERAPAQTASFIFGACISLFRLHTQQHTQQPCQERPRGAGAVVARRAAGRVGGGASRAFGRPPCRRRMRSWPEILRNCICRLSRSSKR